MLSTSGLRVTHAGQARPALDDVSIDVPAGQTLAIVGPSGAGKSTLLRAIAGLLRPNRGDVLLDGRSIVGLPPQERRIALVFQDDALFPHMTVRANLHFGLRTRESARERVESAAAALHVGTHLDRSPRELSGGERQRASIVRALLSDPVALLLDEPLAHLDPALRKSVRDEVLGVRDRFFGPIVYVTHDHAEAMSVGTTLAVLIDGRVRDIGAPARVYDAPQSIDVARFLGDRPMNIVDDVRCVLGIRPENVVVGTGPLEGMVTRRESTGADAYLHVDTPKGEVVARVPASREIGTGERVLLDFPQQFVRHFDAASGKTMSS